MSSSILHETNNSNITEKKEKGNEKNKKKMSAMYSPLPGKYTLTEK